MAGGLTDRVSTPDGCVGAPSRVRARRGAHDIMGAHQHAALRRLRGGPARARGVGPAGPPARAARGHARFFHFATPVLLGALHVLEI